MSWGKFFKAVGKAVAVASAPAQKPKSRSYPMMTIDMIDSNGEAITKAQAVKLFKQYMLAVGYLDKDEVIEHATDFADAMTEHEECLEHDAVDDLDSLKEQLADLKAQRKGETDTDTKEELDEEITSVKDDIESEKRLRQPAINALAAFKKDKRQFLINYVNQQVQPSV